MRIELTEELSPFQLDRWQNHLRTAKSSHPEQDPRFAPVLRADGFEVVFALGWQGDDLQAAAMFALRPHPFLKAYYRDAMTYSGPVCDDRSLLLQFLQEVQATDKFRKVGRLRITPFVLGQEALELGPVLETLGWHVFEIDPIRQTGLVDIRGTEDEIYQKFVKSARYECRKAMRYNLQIDFITEKNGAEEFYECLQRHRLDRKMGSFPKPGFMALVDEVLKYRELGAAVLMRHEGTVVGGWMAFCGHHTAHMVSAITESSKLKELNNLRVAPFLWLDAMRWAKSQGAQWFDVEGYKENMTPDDKFYRVYRYKTEFAPIHTYRVAGHAKITNAFAHLTGNTKDIAKARAKAVLALIPHKARSTEQAAD